MMNKKDAAKSNKFMNPIHIIIIILLLIFTAGIGSIIYYLIYAYLYFKSSYFLNIKNKIKSNTFECNELNKHIEELKRTYIDFKQKDYGEAEYIDNSNYNYKRPELSKITTNNNIYNCSLIVCKNAQQQPFKYICKYFNIPVNEETLEKFEKVLNDFSAAEQGKFLLKLERTKIINSIINEIPFLIKILPRDILMNKLGFQKIDFSQLYFPKYTFRYISGGGNSSMSCSITFNIDTLDRFINYLSEVIKFKNSIKGQRALMTSSLREKIKERDKFTCKNCGNSTKDEPNLLLEIDHIIPLSRGGMTTENNLQTLCWRCNRKKGSKID